MAITWNPQSYSIVRLEVRDSTGDLVGKILRFYSVMLGYTPGYMECIHPVCSHSDVIYQMFSFQLLALTRRLMKNLIVSIIPGYVECIHLLCSHSDIFLLQLLALT